MVEENDQRGWKTKYVPAGKTEVEMKARGIMAEVIAARLTGLRHDKMFLKAGYTRRKKRADIGTNVEVRNTARHDGALALYDNDPDSRIALLVTGTDPFTLRGWILVRDGRLRKFYRKEPPPERWLVPQEMLNPMPLPKGA